MLKMTLEDISFKLDCFPDIHVGNKQRFLSLVMVFFLFFLYVANMKSLTCTSAFFAAHAVLISCGIQSAHLLDTNSTDII